MSDIPKTVKVGTRKSQLALVQTEKVVNLLKVLCPDVIFETVKVTTTGDKILDKPLAEISQTSLFLKELEVALLDKRVDIVVHSLKDVPTDLPTGLVIGAVCEREDTGDVLVVKKSSQATSLSTLPEGSVVGTSSMRRLAQLKSLYPHLNVVDVRGNLNTRLSKLDEEGGPYDALVLAAAGLVRLGWHDRITQNLASEDMLYAVGQGAIGVECRQEDRELLQLLSHLTHHDTLLTCIAERSFLRKLEGGCGVPVAVNCSIDAGKLKLRGAVYSLQGETEVGSTVSCDLESLETNGTSEEPIKPITAILVLNLPSSQLTAAQKLGISLAEELKSQGVSELLKEARQAGLQKGKLKNSHVVVDTQ